MTILELLWLNHRCTTFGLGSERVDRCAIILREKNVSQCKLALNITLTVHFRVSVVYVLCINIDYFKFACVKACVHILK